MQEGEACMLPPNSHCLYGKAAQQWSVLVQFKHLCCSLHGTLITMLSFAKSLLVFAHTTSCPCSWRAPSQLHVSIHSTVPHGGNTTMAIAGLQVLSATLSLIFSVMCPLTSFYQNPFLLSQVESNKLIKLLDLGNKWQPMTLCYKGWELGLNITCWPKFSL